MNWQDILKLNWDAKEFYVGKYRKHERYGGPEEGGWWYYNYEYTGKSIGPLPKEKALELVKSLNNKQEPPREFWEDLPEEDKDIGRGFNISSGITYMLENKKGDREHMETEYYS
tara:strand:+ start:1285 stop:1626 length:342 start_codon:yes stop_codon:yes gene_type:complete